uniref:Uncharacterized protein n=1 Tax=Glossina palpalis gambiensis TaxID=67801 RepID=A0A1B0BH63_9MUSC
MKFVRISCSTVNQSKEYLYTITKIMFNIENCIHQLKTTFITLETSQYCILTIHLRLHLKSQQALLVRSKIKDVPQLTLRMKSPMRRFITLIDTFYDNHIRVVISTDVPLDKLFMAFTQHFVSFSFSGASSSDLGKNAVSSCIPAFLDSSTFNTVLYRVSPVFDETHGIPRGKLEWSKDGKPLKVIAKDKASGGGEVRLYFTCAKTITEIERTKSLNDKRRKMIANLL